jgi:aspartyl-tRNA(Asn)/glutamyl-tRNA(Gln) amidotransferase subunit A
MSTSLWNLTITEAAAALAAGTITSVQLTQAHLNRAAQLDPAINAFVRLEPTIALQQAEASDARRKEGETRGPLDGIPYTLKDVFATKGSITTASSHMLENWEAPYNSTTYSRLSAAGAVLLGKTNTDEFTMGASSETSYFGVTKNPWDTSRVAGGSSGGPAAAMAARIGCFSIATDTGGSIRQPASFCGVVGLKPTYGRVSRFGELAMASSLDQTGPMTATVRDAALVLQAIAGHDELDATCSTEIVPDYTATLDGSLKGVKVGVPAEFFGEGMMPEAEALVRQSIEQLKQLGAEVIPVSLPTAPKALAVYYVICPAEVSSNMARYDGIRFGHSVEREDAAKGAARPLFNVYADSRAEGLGNEVKRRIMLGTHALSAGYYDAYYTQAAKVRQVVADEFADVFTKVDVLAAPVSPHVAFAIGSQVSDPLAMYKEDVLAAPVNVAGLPGMSVPCGFHNGLPVGLQLIGPRFGEPMVLKVGDAYQQATDFHHQLPALATE